MAFFLIVPSVMAVSILLVHAPAKRLGLRIYYTTLIAVAVVSVMVNFAAATLMPTVGRNYFLCLGIMILVSSFLLTLANRFLLKRQHEEDKRFQEEVKAAFEAEKQKVPETEKISPLNKRDKDSFDEVPAYNQSAVDEETKPEVEKVSEETKPEVEKVSEETEPEVEKIPEETEPEVEKIPEEAKPEVEKIPEETEPEVEKILEEALPENFPLEEVFKPLSEPKPEEIPLPKKKPAEENFPLEEVFKPLSEPKPEEIPPPKKKPERTELFPLQEVFRPLSTLNLDKLEEIAREEKNLPHEPELKPDEKIDTLDDLLDKAYLERDKGNIWQAVDIYKKALERYRNDDYAPFVAIDLGNIYKDLARYSKAVKIYEEALTLPAVERNSANKKQFTENLRYLRVVQEVLRRHKALSTPFNKLSEEILKEIDNESKNRDLI